MDSKDKKLEEDVPTNAMGSSSSTAGTGHIDIFDPLLRQKINDARKKRVRDMFRRSVPS